MNHLGWAVALRDRHVRRPTTVQPVARLLLPVARPPAATAAPVTVVRHAPVTITLRPHVTVRVPVATTGGPAMLVREQVRTLREFRTPGAPLFRVPVPVPTRTPAQPAPRFPAVPRPAAAQPPEAFTRVETHVVPVATAVAYRPAPDRPPSASAAPLPPAPRVTPPPTADPAAVSEVVLGRLADQVVRHIDDRALARRERLGRG